MFEDKVDESSNDGAGENPFRLIKSEQLSGLNRRRPLIESQQVDGSENIDTIHSQREYDREVEVAISQMGEDRR